MTADRIVARLDEGITILEASAGTGKTHRVTTETVRELAGGTPLHEILLVTFTTAATSELRSRTWTRLHTISAEMNAHIRGDRLVDPDELTRELLDTPTVALHELARNLDRAIATFDSATILTIHGFCQHILRTLGFAADVDRDPVFFEDDRDLREEVVKDTLVAARHGRPDIGFPLDLAVRIADRVLTTPRVPVVPGDPARGSVDRLRTRFAHRVRGEMERRTRAAGALRYDDLLLRVRDALVDDADGAVRTRLRRQFSVVMVDEFQDTDAIQWEILQTAFAEPPTRLVLVGDPKQAIYAFRGADVHAYLDARAAAGPDRIDRLTTSYRADPDVLHGLDALFGDARLGHDEIRYARVDAAPSHVGSRLHGLRRPAALRLRLLPTDPDRLTITASKGVVQKESAIVAVARDLASEVVDTLDANRGATIDTATGTRPVRAGDIAVLVLRNSDAHVVRDALADVGVPAVVNGTGSVFATPAAASWLDFLGAVEAPAVLTVVRRAALTSLLGWTASHIDTAPDDEWDELHDRLHAWRRLLASGNVAGLFERVSEFSELGARLLSVSGGARELADLRHLASLLQSRAAEHGTSDLLMWMRDRMARADRDTPQDAASRRLETDDHAVQVWTIHRSKGLEYPIVHVPFLWMPSMAKVEDVLVLHDGDAGRIVDVSAPGGDHGALRRVNEQAYLAEEAGGLLRLAYVALTRAQSQVIVHWVRGNGCHESPLGCLLFPDGTRAEPSDEAAIHAADRVRADAPGGAVSVEIASEPTAAVAAPTVSVAVELSRARFQRGIDWTWRRTSYSALTAAAHGSTDVSAAGGTERTQDRTDEDGPDPTTPPDRRRRGVAPEHDERGLEDERLPSEPAATGLRGDTADETVESALRAVGSPFGDTGGGAVFGTLVHGVLEEVDFAAPDLRGELTNALHRQYLRSQVDFDPERVIDGLEAAVRTPLGPMVGNVALADLPRADRLDELHFEMPLAGGDDPRGSLTMDAMADVVERHLPERTLPAAPSADDLLSGYAHLLRAEALSTQTRGFLSGAIDVVARIDDRFVVIDHKSNWLGAPGETLSAWHYRPAAMADAMMRSHYPLQALLYAVALHRYLRWRLPGHDPDRDLGGVLYLFLRGMTGADGPVVDGMPCGVFGWRPPTALVVELSDVLDRGAS